MIKRKMKTMDGNNAAAHVSYAYTDVAAIYPITPSSVMAEVSDEWAVAGKQNIFGETVQLTEMQSEAGAAGAVHGSLAAGALTTTYTASQGLLLMIPNLYKIAAERLPGVFHVSARTISTHALSIFGDHSDVYACRQTGCAMLCESSVQEVMDLAPVAHCAAIKGRLPVINFFDGFRTSHEIQKIGVWDYEDLKDMLDMDAVDEFRKNAMNPNHPYEMGSAQNPDIFFQAREACNTAYNDFPAIVQHQMDLVNEKLGTDYKLFNYYGHPQADSIIICMGSVAETVKETVDYLLTKGRKVGVVICRLFRPFSMEALVDVIPHSTLRINVLDRAKEPGSHEPLYLDVVAALKGTEFERCTVNAGRYGLASKNTTPGNIISVFANERKHEFTIGIIDDVTKLSLDMLDDPDTTPEGTISCKFWGLGSDGTVGANKNSIKIIGDNTKKYAQAYFDYDSKKSGGVTVSHLRFGDTPIRSTYLINKADFVACHNTSYILKFDIVQDLKDGGTFLLNCPWSDEELDALLPGQCKKYICDHKINFYVIDGVAIGKKIGLGGRINTVLQSAFFALSGIIPQDDAIRLMKEAALKSYGKKGEAVVQMNYDAIDAGATGFRKVNVPANWTDCAKTQIYKLADGEDKDIIDFVNGIQKPINFQKGNIIPVSAFKNYADGLTPSGTAAYEKRGIATDVPVWQPDKCIQCNRCAFVCPHAAIRPFGVTAEEEAAAPAGIQMIPMNGMDGYKFTIGLSVHDCTGCGSCANVCPAKEKALVMDTYPAHFDEQEKFDYLKNMAPKPELVEKFKLETVKGSQFSQPLLEYSGACAGCGETPYAKLITQLFGTRMYIANATGCSSIWGNSSPSTPYTKTPEGQGPAWSNSLFEDAAEFGLGMGLAQKAIRNQLKTKVTALIANTENEAVKAAGQEWLDTFQVGATNGMATNSLVNALEECGCESAQDILKNKDYLSKKSQWIFGGDGWAYDIGFGGVDHVIASHEDINIMVFDTEVYSNTGGQASKATPTGAVAEFAAGGKEVKKKDLASIAMSYGYVYVAQISMGADFNQCVKAIAEAEAYPGPSIIIAYAPCINHGIKKGMSKSQTEEALAVESGYWHNFRYNPQWIEEGKPGFVLDSKEPTGDYQEFLKGEVRYNSLIRVDAEKAQALFEQSEANAKERYEYLKKLVTLYGSEN